MMTALWWIVAGVAAIFVITLAGWLWWRIPKLQMRSITASDPKDRADIEDNFRKTVGRGPWRCRSLDRGRRGVSAVRPAAAGSP